VGTGRCTTSRLPHELGSPLRISTYTYWVRVRRYGGRRSGPRLGGRDGEPQEVRRRLRVCALMWEPADFQRGVAVRRGAASLRHLHKGWGLHAADVQAAVFTVLVNICNIMNIMVYLALLHLSNCWWIRNQKKKQSNCWCWFQSVLYWVSAFLMAHLFIS